MIRSFNGTNALRLAVIGMGSRAAHMVRLICNADPEIRVAVVVDPLPEEILRARMRDWKIPDYTDIEIVGDIAALLNQADRFAGLLIGTPCHMHAPIAVSVAVTALPMFLEKPA